MATGSVPITAGSGTEVATHTITEDGKTKHLQRFVPSTSAGAEISPATAAKQDEGAALLGAVNESAPGTDTASSGLNGRLQRIAQRVTSLIALLPASLGQKAKTASLAVALASDDDLVAAVGPQSATAASSDTGTFSLIALVKRALTHLAALVLNTGAAEYEVVEASQTDQMCGSTGAVGDELRGLLVIPTSLSPGAVSIEDGSTNTVVFAGGTDSVATKIPFFIDLQGIKTVNGGWEITTGADVRVIAFGNFT